MKVIIEIPEEKYNKFMYSDDIDEEELDEAFEYLTNGTPIPDNATNGDVIKALFPKDVKVITQHNDMFGRRFIDLRVGQLDCELDNDWWNAPYQKGGKE